MPKKYNSKGFIRWIGGKRLLRKTIAPLIPDNIQSYIEPFGGAAWVMFYKEKWADLEVYNDLDGRLVNLFRIEIILRKCINSTSAIPPVRGIKCFPKRIIIPEH